MAYDETFAQGIRACLAVHHRIVEKKMFGGLCFLLNGNMCCGVIEKKLMLRVGPQQYEKILTMTNVAPMDFTGRPLKGMVYILPEGLKNSKAITKWIKVAVDFVGSLPPKKKTGK